MTSSQIREYSELLLQQVQQQQPEQGQIQRSQQIPEERLAELRQRGLRSMTPSEIREYSEGLLQQVQRHNNPQEQNEATLSQLRRQADQLGGFLYRLNCPGERLTWDPSPTREIPIELRKAMKTMKDIMREFEKYDLYRVQTGRENIAELSIKQRSRELKQKMQRLLEQQGSRESLEQLRDQAHCLEESAQWRLNQTVIINRVHYLESARKRANKLQRSIDSILREQEHGQQRQHIREQRSLRRSLRRLTRQLLRILACGSPR
jgi:hypothetical protein